jgi:hypothetical protein
METVRFIGLTRALVELRSRRSLAGVIGMGALALPGLTTANKKHKRKCRKTKPRSCAKTCGSDCFYCFQRPGTPSLCGDGATVNCANSCTGDQDCLKNSPDRPYCVSRRVTRATGEVEDIGQSFGVTHSCCVSILPC